MFAPIPAPRGRLYSSIDALKTEPRWLRSRLNRPFVNSNESTDLAVITSLTINGAVSTDRCNTCLEFTSWSFKVQSFARALIESQSYFIEVCLGVAGQVGFSGEVLSQQAVGVLVGTALPRALRIAEVDIHLRGYSEALVFGHLQSSIPSQRPSQSSGEFTNLPGQCGDNGCCIFAGHFDQDGETRVWFHESCDVAVAGSAEQISLPIIKVGGMGNYGSKRPKTPFFEWWDIKSSEGQRGHSDFAP
jgi:hypothetical protein